MEIFLARQPIFNRQKKVVAYEILYREGAKNQFDEKIDGDMATTSVISDALIHFGIDTLTNNKRAFINFTRNLILEDVPFYIKPEQVTIEILESVEVDDLLVEKVRQLSEKGYLIALDDFIDDEKFAPLLPYVSIIKVDFLILKSQGRKLVADKYRHSNIKLLAEKVETNADFEEASQLGYDYFQGFFFEKPVVCRGKGMSVSTYNYMEILKETVLEEPDFNKLTGIVKNDLSLTYKLLRLINSPAFYTNNEITSVGHALTMLGINEIRKWVTLIMLRDISSEKPDEIVRVSLARAIFAEQVVGYFGIEGRETEAFLVGLFSLIDTIMEKPLFEILDQLPLREDVKAALIGVRNPFHDMLRLLKYYETANWDMVVDLTSHKALDYRQLNEVYLQAVIEASELLKQS